MPLLTFIFSPYTNKAKSKMDKTDPLQKNANHSHIHTLVEKNIISYDLYHRALDLAGIRPLSGNSL